MQKAGMKPKINAKHAWILADFTKKIKRKKAKSEFLKKTFVY